MPLQPMTCTGADATNAEHKLAGQDRHDGHKRCLQNGRAKKRQRKAPAAKGMDWSTGRPPLSQCSEKVFLEVSLLPCRAIGIASSRSLSGRLSVQCGSC